MSGHTIDMRGGPEKKRFPTSNELVLGVINCWIQSVTFRWPRGIVTHGPRS